MSANIRRPPTGYALSLYFDLLQSVQDLPGIIERTRAHIEQQQDYLARCEQELINASSTIAWMREHQADEIAERQAQRAKILAALKDAGWFKVFEVLRICQCNHPTDDHEYGPDGACTNIIEINDLGVVICDCTGFEPRRVEQAQTEGASEANHER